MNTPRKHHYIPVFYLKQWAGADERVCEYRRVLPGTIVARRTFPDGTGYKRDLYRVDADPDVISPEIESTFMRLVDTQASLAFQQIVRSNGSALDGETRSAWTRFILSLRFRNPEAVSIIKGQMTAVWETLLDNIQVNYETVRYPDDPPNFEEFVARTEREAPQKAALNLLQEIIDNDRVGPTIYNMRWSYASLTKSRFPLLTSDRPLDMQYGLGAKNAYIALPIGPRMLFIAAHDDAYSKHIAAADQTEIVRNVNRAVVHQARGLVWGVDDGQLRFVQNRMSRAPDRPIITGEQRQKAIDAALAANHPAHRSS